MLRNQAFELDRAGQELLQKARACARASDAEIFTKLGLDCLAQARAIVQEMKTNSILTFFECTCQLEKRANYPAYLEFCARNGFETLSETEFDSVFLQIFPDSGYASE